MGADQNMGPSIRHRGQRGQRGQGTRSWRLSVRQMYIAGSGVGWEPNIAIGASCQAALAVRQALSQRAGSRLQPPSLGFWGLSCNSKRGDKVMEVEMMKMEKMEYHVGGTIHWICGPFLWPPAFQRDFEQF